MTFAFLSKKFNYENSFSFFPNLNFSSVCVFYLLLLFDANSFGVGVVDLIRGVEIMYNWSEVVRGCSGDADGKIEGRKVGWKKLME